MRRNTPRFTPYRLRLTGLIRVMEKIGMKRDIEGDFAHPELPADHPLSKHVLYRLQSDSYANLL
jgi:hypothetical protein